MKCRRCGRNRSQAMFEGFKRTCRLCLIDRRIYKYLAESRGMAYCSKCREIKPRNDFYPDRRNTKRMVRSHCKKCCIKEDKVNKSLNYLSVIFQVSKGRVKELISCVNI